MEKGGFRESFNRNSAGEDCSGRHGHFRLICLTESSHKGKTNDNCSCRRYMAMGEVCRAEPNEEFAMFLQGAIECAMGD